MADKNKIFGFKLHDVVWAKMPGYCYWPGKIVEPNTHQIVKLKKSLTQHCIFFFGSKNYAWIEEKRLKPFEEFKDELKLKGKPKNQFSRAIIDAESFLENPNISSLFEQKTPIHKMEVRQTKRESDKLLNEDLDNETSPVKKPRISSLSVSSKSSNEFPNSEPIRSDIEEATKAFKSLCHIETSSIVYGLIGVGLVGGSILKNLLSSGNKIVIYNRTLSKCDQFLETKCSVAGSPREVFEQAYIIFVCVSDCDAVNEIFFNGEGGIISADCNGIAKGLVMMSSVDCETSRDINGAILMKNCRYLEAQIQGSISEIKERKAIIIAAGDKSLYEDCKTCFDSFAKDTYYLEEKPEDAVKMNLILNSLAGVQLIALTEALTLTDDIGISLRDILEIISLSNVGSDFIVDKGMVIVNEKFHFPSKNVVTMQNDLKMAIELGDTLMRPLPLVAASKEVFKSAKRMGFGFYDSAAAYLAMNSNKYWEKP